MGTPEPAQIPRRRIEYEIVEAPHLSELKAKLSEAGSHGWSLAAHSIHEGRDATQFIVILQRFQGEES